MTREDAEALVTQILEARGPDDLQALIEAHAADMGPLFFELLEARAPEELLTDVARLHLALTGGSALAHLELAMRLLEAQEAGRLEPALEDEAALLDEDAADTLIKAAETGIARRADLGFGQRMLAIARAVVERFGHDRLRPALALEESSLHLLRDDTPAAERCLRAALQADGPPVEPLVREALAINLGIALLRQGRYEETVRHYEALLPGMEDARLRLSARSNLALAHASLGHTGTALTLFQELAEACRTSGDEDLLATVHGNLALTYERLGLDREEEMHLLASLRLALHPSGAERTRDWHAVATGCCNLFLFHLRRRDFEKAREWLGRYERYTAGTGVDPAGVTRDRLALELAIASGDGAQARALAEGALARAGDRVDEEVLALLGSAGRVELASGRLEHAAALFDRVAGLCGQSGHEELLHASLGYLGVVRLKQGRAAEAFALLERMVGSNRALRRHVDDPLHQFSFSGQHETLYDTVVGALIEHGDGVRLFEGLQAAKAFAIGHRAPEPARFARLAAALPRGAAFLEYDHRDGRTMCVAVRGGADAPEVVPLEIRAEELAQAATTFDRRMAFAAYQLDDEPFAGLEPLAQRLLLPVLDRLGGGLDHLVIAPAGPATRLPFHVFPLDAHTRVIDRFAVSYAPNATVWLGCAERSRRPRSAAVLAHPRAGEPPLAVEQFHAEERAVRALLEAAGCRVAGDEAELLHRFRDADVLHVAAHGHFDAARPAASGVLLALGGVEAFLSLEELARAEAAAELVFLSGCDTGRVAPLRNQEALGLMSVLLGQRVTAAVLSFWPVLAADPVTVEVVAAFYRGWLHDGLSKAEALRRAMLAHRDRPLYDWAGFGLFGYGAEPGDGRG